MLRSPAISGMNSHCPSAWARTRKTLVSSSGRSSSLCGVALACFALLARRRRRKEAPTATASTSHAGTGTGHQARLQSPTPRLRNQGRTPPRRPKAQRTPLAITAPIAVARIEFRRVGPRDLSKFGIASMNLATHVLARTCRYGGDARLGTFSRGALHHRSDALSYPDTHRTADPLRPTISIRIKEIETVFAASLPPESRFRLIGAAAVSGIASGTEAAVTGAVTQHETRRP